MILLSGFIVHLQDICLDSLQQTDNLHVTVDHLVTLIPVIFTFEQLLLKSILVLKEKVL